MRIRNFIQRGKKGYCDEDLYSIDAWFIDIFPRMLEEFIECKRGYPYNRERLYEEVKNMPPVWLERQKEVVNKMLEKYGDSYNLEDGMCCWIIILLRMKHCFERCDEWHEDYDVYRKEELYVKMNEQVEKYKKEAFYLLEKYFYDLWW